MKNVFVLLLCFGVSNSIAQHEPFIRLYNNQHHKFLKGRIQMTSDSGLTLLKKGKESEVIKYTSINQIWLKRSVGNTLLTTGAIPMASGIILGSLLKNEKWNGFGGIILFFAGLTSGTTLSGIKLVNNPKPLLVEGNHQKWMEVKMKLDQKLSK